jgi:hypothetical protein
MFNLPKNCCVNKFIPKKVFYEKVGISSLVKDDFVNLVDRITWLYKISEYTIGISKTDNVEEIQIFQIDIREKKIPKSIIKTICKGIPYKILFLIKYNDEYSYSVKVDDIYSTEWNENIIFDFNAINLEIIYENIVKKIINKSEDKRNFEEIIEETNNINDIETKINRLESKLKNEKQFNRKVEINNEIIKLKNELEEINNE